MKNSKFKVWNDKEDISWEGPLEGWTKTYANNNVWRVQPHMDVDDLLQEGFLCYHKCKEIYKKDEPKQFLGRYKRIYSNRVHDLSKIASCEKEALNEMSFEEEAEERDLLPLSFIDKAPPEIKSVINGLLDSSKNRKDRFYLDGTRARESLNEFLCRLAKEDPKKTDMVESTKAYFGLN